METQSRYITLTRNFEINEDEARQFERQIVEATQKCFHDFNENFNYILNEIRTIILRLESEETKGPTMN